MRLRILLFAAFSAIALLPAAIIAFSSVTQLNHSKQEIVENTHLQLARNLGTALDRYATDVRSAFELASRSALAGESTIRLHDLMRDLNFVHLCLANAKTGEITGSVVPDRFPCPERVPEDRFGLFVDLARSDMAVFSHVMPRPKGLRTLYVLRRYDDMISIGAIDTSYIIARGSEIAFGERGHAAIVDHRGNLLAHPLKSWIAESKNIAKLSPVQSMLRGETGVTRFFSPALKADMVAGFTHVPSTGWGVMIPQPAVEIDEYLEQTIFVSIATSLATLLLAAIVAWFLSGRLSSALRQISSASTKMAAGDLDARAGDLTGIVPEEFKSLARNFDSMAETISKSTQELNSALKAANLAGQAKSQFLATVTHEIRTPMNGVLGSAEMLLDTPLNDDQQLIGRTIHESASALLTVVNDVLDMSKIEAGKLEPNLAPASIREMMDGIECEFSLAAASKSLDFACLVDETVPILALTDVDRVRQIVVNLIGNAIKFTEKGFVRVSARVETDHSAKMRLIMSVQDSGRGIAEEDLKTLFEPFSQGGDEDGKIAGTGLGLTISKRLAEILGGSVEAQSLHGEGSTFRVSLPIDPVDLTCAKPSPASPESSKASGAPSIDLSERRIMVVEDHSTNRWMLERQLRKLGLRADLFENGNLALKAFLSQPYDLVITDYLMPGMDGAELAQAIRQDDAVEKRHTYILGLTANAFQDALDRCYAAGMDHVMTKPASQGMIADAISKAGIELAGKTPSPEGETTNDESASELFSDATLLELFGDDPAAGHTWLQDFLDALDDKQETLVAITQNFETRKSEIQNILHGLKSISGSVGALRLAEESTRLHDAGKDAGASLKREEIDHLADLCCRTSARISRFLKSGSQ